MAASIHSRKNGLEPVMGVGFNGICLASRPGCCAPRASAYLTACWFMRDKRANKSRTTTAKPTQTGGLSICLG
eukprot:5574671-Amphidinium_carterae.1